jgi:hypothetical protein
MTAKYVGRDLPVATTIFGFAKPRPWLAVSR